LVRQVPALNRRAKFTPTLRVETRMFQLNALAFERTAFRRGYDRKVVKRYKGERRRYYSGGYMGKKRRELVMRVGYDSKNAAHLIRLLRMGIEFLTEGALHVERADGPELLEIKRGGWRWKK
jgi:hypothetical protein